MIVYCTGHLSSEVVTKAVAEGFGWRREVSPWERPLHGPAAFYGRDRGTLIIVHQCQTNRVPWYMVDNGYMGRSVLPEYDGCYKISKNGFQTDGYGEPDEARLAQVLDITGQTITAKWREPTPRGHILICPPIVPYERLHWFSHTHWMRNVKSTIRKVSDRKFRVRYKPGDARAIETHKMKHDFKDCHAVVTHDSNIAVEAIMAGIPVFTTGLSPAQAFGNVDINLIEYPKMELDRTEWLARLANEQWTLDEIRSGMANAALTRSRLGP